MVMFVLMLVYVDMFVYVAVFVFSYVDMFVCGVFFPMFVGVLGVCVFVLV